MIVQEIDSFVENNRVRFDVIRGNIFAGAFGAVRRYRLFIEKIVLRLQDEKLKYQAAFGGWNNLVSALPSGASGTLKPEMVNVLSNVSEASFNLQLDLESLFIFAKVLLDRIAHAIEYSLGKQGRGMSLDSHDQLVKGLKSYAEAKGKSVPQDLLELGSRLKTMISDFRDYQIEHEKSPRTIKAAGLDPATGELSLSVHRLYPKPSEFTAPQSALPSEVVSTIDAYISLVLGWLSVLFRMPDELNI